MLPFSQSHTPLLTSLFASVLLLVGCGGDTGSGAEGGNSEAPALSGTVRLDGSSTVFPISEAIAEEFQILNQGVRVTVGSSGTGGGFSKFMAGETDINDASRAVKAEEIELGKAQGVEYLELSVAYDGLSIVVNPANTWVDALTVAELKRIWEPGSTVDSWNDVRPEWPDKPLHLYGPGTDSGTFDYFTEVVVGATGAARPDYTASENDNILVQGVAGDEGGLGFFGFAYYEHSASQLRLIPVDGGTGPVAPTAETINNGSYSPLSRPLFIYVSKASAARPEVRAFIDFYLDAAPSLVTDVGYIPLPADQYAAGKAAFAAFH
ncbi:MAG: PstS family phosphate ABC transporter substrate-binding protein [Pseudohongiellaceae bacterium]|jgi:phosphate transport system substrate-binding protein